MSQPFYWRILFIALLTGVAGAVIGGLLGLVFALHRFPYPGLGPEDWTTGADMHYGPMYVVGLGAGVILGFVIFFGLACVVGLIRRRSQPALEFREVA